MSERIRSLRKYLNVTQQELAEKIGITRNTLASYETGKSNPSDAAVSLICAKLGVSESWLRTGEGEMFRSRSAEDVLMDFAKDVSYGGDESFKKKFVSAIAQMDDAGWEHFEKWLTAFLEKYQGSATSEGPEEPEELDIEKEVAKYRQELITQKNLAERSKALSGIKEKGA